MENIKAYVKDKRSSLSDSSITTYSSILKNLYKRVFDKEDFDLKLFETNIDKVLKSLEDLPPNKRKTILSALVVITDKQEYRGVMMNDVKEYGEEIKKQEKTDTQEENWVEQKEIKNICNDLKSDATAVMKKKNLDMNDLHKIQNYIIICLLGGMYIPPRRNKDYCDFRVSGDFDKTKWNYMDGNKLIFNSYKTAKAYGKQEIVIDNGLKKILDKWIKINPTEWLLFDMNKNPLTSVKLNQRINKIFGNKKVGVNILRHSYLTDKYADVSIKNKKLEQDMKALGSSMSMATTYIKTD